MYDVAIVGGGPAGMAAAVKAKEHVDNVVIIERNSYLGGVLPQCIHTGFGLHYFKEDLTGPEFSYRMEKKVAEMNIEVLYERYVKSIEKIGGEYKFVIKTNEEDIKTKAIVFSTGCKERTRYMLNIPGDRPSGVFTAGTAQMLMDLYGYLPGKRVVVLGSGDIGLIMARRFAMEGSEVVGVYEILPYPSGLPRNIKQCLEDFGIPLYLRHTVVEIKGKKRLEGVVVAQLDDNGNIVRKEFVKCDTLIIAAGLIPNTKLMEDLGVEIDPGTNGPVIDEHYQTNIEGVFSCGNSLIVNDLVDYAVMQGEIAGKYAALYAKGILNINNKEFYRIEPGNGIRFVVPHFVSGQSDVNLIMRVTKPYNNATLIINDFRRKYPILRPSEMLIVKLPAKYITGNLRVEVRE